MPKPDTPPGPGAPTAPETAQARRLPWRPLALAAGLAAAVAATALLPVSTGFADLQAWLQQLGPAAILVFAALFVAGTATILPAGPLSIAAGLLFGAAGLPLALLAAPLGATLAFAVSRRLLRTRIRAAIAGRPVLRAIETAIATQGWRIVLLTRLSPLVPFNLQNYLFGVTPIRFGPFLAATIVGIVPNTALCVYVGSLGRTSLSAAGWPALVLPGIGLLCSLAAVALVGLAARRALLRSMHPGPTPP